MKERHLKAPRNYVEFGPNESFSKSPNNLQVQVNNKADLIHTDHCTAARCISLKIPCFPATRMRHFGKFFPVLAD